MDLTKIQKAYARWAPHYDLSFGLISDAARNFTVSEINRKPGKVLEVGVGTGLSLPMYAPDMPVTGIDVSDIMLQRAEKRVREHRLRNIQGLEIMDATQMRFADNHFDTITAMYIMSVVPDPEGVMREMARVVKQGGDIYILNHFSTNKGVLAVAERVFAPMCRLIGWHSEFDMGRLMNVESLELIEIKRMRPFGLFDLLHFRKKH